ncbi:RPA-interacting protein isoform X1 [Cuculus canorus]|uniref:RPA-interacting protein isoform X1 n=1 Tax=Cuculus canorus TaxID=55661 RepID=UPI0023AAC55C|nr:RPA-interacting protein isoform X1 [Cuculus canorus]
MASPQRARCKAAAAQPGRGFCRRLRGATPPWKEAYRHRCMERLRSSRAQLLERYRRGAEDGTARGALLVPEVMEQEWQALQAGGAAEGLAQMPEDPDELAVLEEIQQELILKEQSVIEEYERSLQFDEECLNAMLDGLDASDKVICPVCRKNNLTVRNHLVFCQCGLYITTQCLSGYDRGKASSTPRKHRDRAQSSVLPQPRVHRDQRNGGRNQSPHELPGESQCQFPQNDLCLDPLLHTMGRNQKSIDLRVW